MQAILQRLEEMYPNPKTALNHETPFELLVATILSAQCTDERVNLITPGLFAQYPDAHALAQASEEDVAELIKTAGRGDKAELGGAAEILVDIGGEPPRTGRVGPAGGRKSQRHPGQRL